MLYPRSAVRINIRYQCSGPTVKRDTSFCALMYSFYQGFVKFLAARSSPVWRLQISEALRVCKMSTVRVFLSLVSQNLCMQETNFFIIHHFSSCFAQEQSVFIWKERSLPRISSGAYVELRVCGNCLSNYIQPSKDILRWFLGQHHFPCPNHCWFV